MRNQGFFREGIGFSPQFALSPLFFMTPYQGFRRAVSPWGARGLVIILLRIILLRKIIARPCILAGHDFASQNRCSPMQPGFSI
jgi:hypothetical protein